MPLYKGTQSPPDFFGDKQKTVQENKSFFLRVAALVLLVVLGFGFLVLRITYLTVGRGSELAELSEQNYLHQVSIPAPRGAIVDRYGRIIAQSVTRFNISISPLGNQEADLAYSLDAVRTVCPTNLVPEARTLTAAEIIEKPKTGTMTGNKKERPSRDRWKPIPLATNLTLEQITPLMERLVLLPGLIIEPAFQRIYPFGRETGHLTGHMQKIPATDLDAYLEKGYEMDDLIGKSGLEQAFEDVLCGKKGSELVYRNAAGRILRTLSIKNDDNETSPSLKSADYDTDEPKRGGQVTLTLDLELQRSVNRILDEQTTASIVVMDPRNGDILAIASKPNYDANHPEETLRKQSKDSSFCRALSGSYWPGSTFKMITAAAWLQSTGADPTRVIECDRRYFYGKGPKDYLTCLYSHGGENLKSALKVSCNVYFYTAAAELELDPFLKTCADFGFGKPTGLPIGGRGRLGMSRDRAHISPTRIDKIKLGIGQGELLKVTPLQMAIAYCAMANGGSRYEAHIVRETHRPGEQPLVFPPTVLSQVGWTQAQRDAIGEGLKAVVSEENGTGRYGEFPKEWGVAGKTGTAQKGKGRPVDAWFACYAPFDNPEVCVVVLVEDAGGHGGEISSPVARKVLNDYYRLRFEQTGQPVPGGAATLTPPPVPNLDSLSVESGSIDGEDDEETTRTSPASLLQSLPGTLEPSPLSPPPLRETNPGLTE